MRSAMHMVQYEKKDLVAHMRYFEDFRIRNSIPKGG